MSLNYTIKEYYIDRNKNKIWRDNYFSSSEKKDGNLYFYTSTNYRTINAFVDTFIKFLDYENIDRSNWEKHQNHQEEISKQWVVRLKQSKLFYEHDHKYILTKKGKAFKDIINSIEFNTSNNNTRWVLIYIFLNNSYFDYKVNYIYVQSKAILNDILKCGYSKKYILDEIKSVIKNNDNPNIDDILVKDIFWILSFCTDPDFLDLFRTSSDQDKQDLYKYVINNHSSKNYDDCISEKLKPSGNYQIKTFIDEAKMLYFTLSIIDSFPSTFEDYVKKITDLSEDIFGHMNVSVPSINKYIDDHIDVFSAIYRDIFKPNDVNDVEDSEDTTIVSEIGEKIDDTTSEGQDKINRISSVLKKQAKEFYKYTCALDPINHCKYFTSKEDNNNYLEIHHLVPREFSNEFDNSIEILENYIPLCPHCHRLLHHGVDREKAPSLSYLFKEKNTDLKNKKIELDYETLSKFYDIDE